MNVRLTGSTLWLLMLLAFFESWTPAAAQSDPTRTPLPAPVKVKQGMANVPALSPLWLLPAEAAKYNVQVEQVLFQRFADERTALATGDLDIAAFGPQDITLGLGQGAKSMIGVAGIGSGNDCLLVRKGDDIKEWAGIGAKSIGVGAGSISWLKFAATVQENGLELRQAPHR
jgi:ABC-type nitrate/sulfonate/bicarbonate transport system substrate-binding protein